MVKVKAGGIVLGGLAAYLIISKGMNVVGGAVRNICESRKWKNYYKYGKEGNMVPPGYSMHTHENENGDTVEVNDGKQPVKQPQESGKTSTGEALGRAVSDAILKMINDTFGAPKAAEGASEGEIEASEKPFACPRDCDNCSVTKCPHEHLKNGGKITEWSEDGRPIGGCYPWDEGEELHWFVDKQGAAHSVVEDISEETGKMEQGTDDNIVQLHVDDILVNGKDPGDPDRLNRKDGDYDGDISDDDRLRSDPGLIKMAKKIAEKTHATLNQLEEEYKP
jgi:hypothetical protein